MVYIIFMLWIVFEYKNNSRKKHLLESMKGHVIKYN